MVGHRGSSAGSYLADPTSLIPSHYASIVATSTVRVKSPSGMIVNMLTHTYPHKPLRKIKVTAVTRLTAHFNVWPDV